MKRQPDNNSIPPGRSTPVPKRPERDRRVRQHSRIARVLSVLNLIQSRGRWNARAIASELECSERTVFRDLEVLQFAGIPWFFDELDQCYRVRPDFHFPTLTLTEDEVIDQAVAAAISNELTAGSNATEATSKFIAGSSRHLQSVFADASRLISVLDLQLADHSKHQEIIRTFQYALLHKRRVKGTYQSPYQTEKVRLKLHPYRLCLIKQAWYVVGHEDGKDKVKTYRIARFKTARLTTEPATIPDQFDLKTYFGNAWSVYRGETSHDIRLKFSPEAARLVTETKWHHTQKVKRHRDGSVTLSFNVDGLDEIVHWVMSWADRVVVEQPEELRSLLLSQLNRAIEMNAAANDGAKTRNDDD